MIKNKIFTRIASIFLVLVMVLALVPSSVFAVTSEDPGNNGETGGGGGAAGDTSGTMSSGNIGMRFSLYWGENKDSFLSKDYEKIRQIGHTIDVNITQYGMDGVPTKASLLSVYARMSDNAEGMEFPQIADIKYNESNYCYTKKDYKIISEVPQLLNTSFTAYPKEQLDAFFEGDNFANTAEIIKIITEGTGITVTNTDFANGTGKDVEGKPKNGIYKLFYKPILYFPNNGKNIAMTLRDAIAYAPTHTKFYQNYARYYYRMANSVYLEKDEPAIGMDGTDSAYPATDNFNTILGYMNKGIKPDGKAYKSMGVGVVTGGEEVKGNPPQIVKTYVTIDSVDADGTLVLTQIGDSIEIITTGLNFYTEGELVSKGLYSGSGYQLTGDDRALTNIPKINPKEYVFTKDFAGVALLNDIISTPKDLLILQIQQQMVKL